MLFLRRQWSTRTCYITLIISWGVILFDLCIGNFVIADPVRRGAYYGISGYWCWITPAYPVERYTTEYLFMFASAGFSFILYSLIFFKLRGNISLSDGYKLQFHQRPKVRVGRTAAGTFIMTDDRRVESHLTTVAKQMLWYPIAYTILVLPIAAARFSTFSGASVPFSVTIFTAAVFMLTGFVNAVLFCLTRNVLPGTWRQRFGIGSTFQSRRGNTGVASRTNQTWQGAPSTRVGTVGARTIPIVLNVGVEKDVEIKYDDEELGPSSLKGGSPTMPPSPPRIHGGDGHLSDTYDHHVEQLPQPGRRDARRSIRIETERDNDRRAGAHAARQANTGEWTAPGGQGRGRYGPAPGLGAAHASFHPLAAAPPVHVDTRQARPSSILIIGHGAPHAHAPWPRTAGGGGSEHAAHWTGSNL